jgi:lipopolysaccharide transport system ATP-binding protein
MSSIKVNNVGKAYKHYNSRFGRLLEWISPFNTTRHTLKWVLRGINFEVQPGEAVGIIGINGAGKSTLLKIITNTLQPTEGNVQFTGRVAALLELGMGFHPEFSGRQNAIMAGQLLGYSTADLLAKMPEIEAFAEIGDAIDEPVRTYSSGMQVRLAFSVATVFRPDILIVDEALSVGDTYFQHKSFDRIRQFRKQGTTLLLVSHDKAAIQSICDRAILLDKGAIIKEGNPEEVMNYYNALIADKENSKLIEKTHNLASKKQVTSGTGEASVQHIELLNAQHQPIDTAVTGECLTLRITVRTHAPIAKLVLGYMIKDRLGQDIYGTSTAYYHKTLIDTPAEKNIIYDIQFALNLGPGNYSISTALASSETHLENNYEWRDLALVFNVINANQPVFVGSTWLPPAITVHHTQ